MSSADQLRMLPAVDEVLHWPTVVELRQQHGHQQLKTWVRAAIQDCRQQVRQGQPIDAAAVREQILQRIRQLAASDAGQALQSVINATGVLLHTNLGRAALSQRAVSRVQQVAAYTNLELDLESGRRSRRGERVTRLLARLTGAEDALIVNNCAAATMLVLQGLAAGREVIISRGQLVEIGGGFRLPEVFAAAGVRLREVGTTNRTYLHDYEQAIGEDTGAIIRVHRSNFRQTGFVTEPTIQELIGLQTAGLPVIDDIGSGNLYDLSQFGVDEPIVGDSVQAGSAVVLFSGDKLFGGPQCGIIVGRQTSIDRLRSSPLMRALRVDKLTLAALEATVEIHLQEAAFSEVPVLQMLSRDLDQLRSQCTAALQHLSDLDTVEVRVTDCESQIGGGAVPGYSLASCGLQICGRPSDTAAGSSQGSFDVDRLAQSLRQGQPAVMPRICDDKLLLDWRTVPESQQPLLIDRLRQVLSEFQPDGA